MTIVGPLLVHIPPSYGAGHLMLEKRYTMDNRTCSGMPHDSYTHLHVLSRKLCTVYYTWL